MNIAQIYEALKPSQYRDLVKGWDKSKYEDLFKRYSGDKKHYRIYIPVNGNAKVVDAPDDIIAACAREGYVIEDYVAGIASKDEGKRKIKIGKLLARGAPELAQKFANDPKRAASKESEYYVVISRHPYDVAGMSTDRGWNSCMNLGAGIGRHGTDQRGRQRGVNFHYVPTDIKEGTIIAYLVKNTDKNVNAPLARLLIKPFIDIIDGKRIALGIQDRVYGTPVDGFVSTVTKWVNDQNDHNRLTGLFELNPKLYNDGYGSTKRKIGDGKDVEQEDLIYKDWEMIRTIEDPSERLQLIAVKRSTSALRYIKNPTEKVIDVAIDNDAHGVAQALNLNNSYKMAEPLQLKLLQKTNGTALKYMPTNISEDIQVFLVSIGNLYDRIKDHIGHEPSERIQETSVEHYPRSVNDMENPSEKIKKLALKHDGTLIELIENPTEEELLLAAHSFKDLLKWMLKKKMKVPDAVLKEAIKSFPAQIRLLDSANAELVKHAIMHDGHAIEYILHRKNLSPDLKASLAMDAVKQNGLAIKWIEHPSKQLQMAAVKQDPNALKFIKNPAPQAVKYAKENGYHLKQGEKTPAGWDKV